MVIKEEPQNITSEARGALASREITEVISERSKLSTVSTQETGIATLESKLSNAKLLPISAIMKTVWQEEDWKMEGSRHKKMQYGVSRSPKKEIPPAITLSNDVATTRRSAQYIAMPRF